MTYKSPRVSLNRMTIVKAGVALENALVKLGDGYVRYKEGQSDQTIADAMVDIQPGLKASSIARLRWQLGYKLNKVNNLAGTNNSSEDVETLKLQFDALLDLLVEYGFPRAEKLRITEKAKA